MSLDQIGTLFLDLCGVIAVIGVVVALVGWRRTGRLGMDTWQAGASDGLVLLFALTQVLKPESTVVTRAIFTLAGVAAACGLITVLQYRRARRDS